MPHLYLRKVVYPQSRDSYRVILKDDGEETEIGSVGVVNTLGANSAWKWV